MKTITTKLALILTLSLSYASIAFGSNHNLTSDTILSNFGMQNIEYSYKITDHWTIGLTGASTSRHITNNGIELNGNSYGGVARYYIDPAFLNDSWYLMGSATKTNFDVSINSGGTQYNGKSDDMMAAGGGYHWFWNSFNIAFGGVISNPSKIELKDVFGNRYKDEFNTNIGLELKIGGKF